MDTFSICARAASVASRNCSTPLPLLRARSILARATARGVRKSWAMLSPDALELLDQARDFVQHQIDRARHFVDVAVLIGDRQTRIELAIHDPDDGVVDPFVTLRRAAGKNRADCEDHQNCREGARSPARATAFPAGYRSPTSSARAKARRRSKACVRRRWPARGRRSHPAGALPAHMGAAIDRNRGHARHVAEQEGAIKLNSATKSSRRMSRVRRNCNARRSSASLSPSLFAASSTRMAPAR